MKAIVCKAWGPPDDLFVQDLPDLAAGPGEVVVDVKAAGVNFPDVLTVQGKYQYKPDLPFTPGNEFAGVIRLVGDGVTGFQPGDRVIAFTRQGAFAEQAVVPASMLMPMPPGMDFDIAAAITLTYGTSHHAVVGRAALQAGETMLVLGAAGGVEAIFTVLALRDQLAPATLNLAQPDPAAQGIDIVTGAARKLATDYAISNGFGFGGVNASLVFGRL